MSKSDCHTRVSTTARIPMYLIWQSRDRSALRRVRCDVQRRLPVRPRRCVDGAAVPVGRAASVVTLGKAVFIVADRGYPQPGTVYIDRPASNGSFVTSTLGASSTGLAERRLQRKVTLNADAVRVGNRVAVVDGHDLRLYDESGRAELTANVTCSNDVLAATTRDMLFTLCTQPQMPMTLAAFRR